MKKFLYNSTFIKIKFMKMSATITYDDFGYDKTGFPQAILSFLASSKTITTPVDIKIC